MDKSLHPLHQSWHSRALAGVALVVGTTLNLINQGDVLFGSARLNLLKLMLTYSVPFYVATYGAVSYRLSTEARRVSDEV